MIDLYNLLASGVLKIVVAIIGIVITKTLVPWAQDVMIPWLKEKRLYDLCYKFVLAAEKKAMSGFIPKAAKKQFVLDCLKAKGIVVTDEVDAYIESAVEELDLAFESGILYLDGLFADTAYEEIPDIGECAPAE